MSGRRGGLETEDRRDVAGAQWALTQEQQRSHAGFVGNGVGVDDDAVQRGLTGAREVVDPEAGPWRTGR